MIAHTLVNVATDREMGSTAVRQLWIAAVSPSRAVEAVLAKVPLGWAARLSSSDTLTADQIDALKLRAGDTMELAF
jgi:hypothetical protein